MLSLSLSAWPAMDCLRILLVFLVLVSAFLAVPAVSDSSPADRTNGEALQFRLLHRSEVEPSSASGDDKDDDMFRRFADITRRDLFRQKRITEMLCSRRRRATETSFEAPIFSGAYTGTGEYFVKLNIGTPAKEYLLVADTGSDLTWTKCQNGGSVTQRTRRRKALEDCVPSSSFVPFMCSTDSCRSLPFTTTVCPTPSSPCLYDYQYADGSSTKGRYGNDTVTVTDPNGNVSVIRDVLVGRSSEFQGVSFNKTDGVLGLGFSGSSFAVKAAQLYGGKFSYCLVDHLKHTAQNYLVFGNNPRVANRTDMRFAPLVLDQQIQPFYGLEVDGISLDGIMLPIPNSVWKFNFSSDSITGGVMIDSGMTLTSLVKPAYDIVMAALDVYFKDFPRFVSQPFELCFNVSQLSPAQSARLGPIMQWHLAGGANFVPHVGSYVTVVAKDVKCVSIIQAPWPGMSIIGNILQQKYLWQFDLEKGMLGFAPSLCSD